MELILLGKITLISIFALFLFNEILKLMIIKPRSVKQRKIDEHEKKRKESLFAYFEVIEEEHNKITSIRPSHNKITFKLEKPIQNLQEFIYNMKTNISIKFEEKAESFNRQICDLMEAYKNESNKAKKEEYKSGIIQAINCLYDKNKKEIDRLKNIFQSALDNHVEILKAEIVDETLLTQNIKICKDILNEMDNLLKSMNNKRSNYVEMLFEQAQNQKNNVVSDSKGKNGEKSNPKITLQPTDDNTETTTSAITDKYLVELNTEKDTTNEKLTKLFKKIDLKLTEEFLMFFATLQNIIINVNNNLWCLENIYSQILQIYINKYKHLKKNPEKWYVMNFCVELQKEILVSGNNVINCINNINKTTEELKNNISKANSHLNQYSDKIAEFQEYYLI